MLKSSLAGEQHVQNSNNILNKFCLFCKMCWAQLLGTVQQTRGRHGHEGLAFSCFSISKYHSPSNKVLPWALFIKQNLKFWADFVFISFYFWKLQLCAGPNVHALIKVLWYLKSNCFRSFFGSWRQQKNISKFLTFTMQTPSWFVPDFWKTNTYAKIRFDELYF